MARMFTLKYRVTQGESMVLWMIDMSSDVESPPIPLEREAPSVG